MDGKSYYFLLSGAIITFLTSLISLDWYFFWNTSAATNATVMTQVTINKGDSIKKVAHTLAQTQLFSRPFYLKVYLEYQSLFTYFKYGDYLLNPQNTPTEILNQLIEGRVRLHKFTITPGLSWEQLSDKISNSDIIEQELFTQKDIEKFCQTHRIPSIEGWLAPDSYFIAKNTKETKVLSVAVNQQKKVLKDLLQENSCPLDINDTITLASIIEKESGYIDEYKLISSTYHNRLKQGMKLQSDPTVRYAQTNLVGVKLKYGHLKNKHPHNTYINYGLPPSAIAYPSKNAIIAACLPSQTAFLYFVADKTRTKHIFTTNYKEHLHVKNAQRQ